MMHAVAALILVTDQAPGPNICCELDFVDSVTHEINENWCPTKNSGFTVCVPVSRFARALCAAHIHILCQCRTSQIFFFQKSSHLNTIVLKQVEENAKTK